jgi:hypothetical protein
MLGGGVACPNNEFLRFLAFAVWHIPEERQAYLQHLLSDAPGRLTAESTLQDFGIWLCLQTNGWINLVHLVVWAWDRIAATQRQPTPPQMPPLQPTVAWWCAKYQLCQSDQDILVGLGFMPGDDLKEMFDEEDWKALKLLPLEKKCLIKASEKDKEERSWAMR